MTNRTSIFVATSLVVAALAFTGCVSSFDTGSGTGGANGGPGTGGGPVSCGAGGSTADAGSQLANFASVVETVNFYCGGSACHNAGQAPDLFGGDLYTTLTTYKSAMCGNRVLVKPCAPNESPFYLAQKGQCAGLDKMPKGCVDNCTDPDYLEGIRQWIAN